MTLGRYQVRLVERREELEEVLRLRFRVFNLELGEGLAESFETGMDIDRFDAVCHHLLVEDTRSGEVIGTYRMQTHAMAMSAHGFYSTGEYDLGSMPEALLERSIEVGRACIEGEHRNRQVLFLLWRGLARYMLAWDARYLFGCCSLSSQEPRAGVELYDWLRREGRLHPSIQVSPQPGFECVAELRSAAAERVHIPLLFATYLRFGVLVCGPPAIDRAFQTIDFFVLFDVDSLDEKTYRTFFH